MLSIAPLGMASDASATYCQSQVSEEAKIEGYYHGHGEPAGQWHGNGGIAALGLEPGQRVTDKDFAAILRGFHPETGEALVQGAGDNHRAGWDLTFSAPKSVSAIWAVAQADLPELHADMSKMQQAAVAKALQHLEQEAAYTRRGKGGAEKEKLPGLITSQYEHCDTRELDPDLHTHMLVMNLAQRADGTWGSIDPQRLYQWKMAAGAIYRAELAAQLQAHGFKIEADRDSFRIAGVPQDLCDNWSKRRAQITEALEKSGHNSAKAAEIANLGTRKTKQEAKNRDELFAGWQAEAEELGFTAESILQLMQAQAAEQQPQSDTASPVITTDNAPKAEAAAVIDGDEPVSIYDKLTQNQSTFTVQELWRTVAVEHQHRGQDYESIKARVDELLSDQEIILLRHNETGEQRYTTRTMMQIERDMAHSAKSRASEVSHALGSGIVDQALSDFKSTRGFELSAEQQASVRHITQNAGAVQLVRGAAGAGKSTMAEAARLAWEASGFQVRGAALSGKAAQGLEEGSGIKSQTIASLLSEIDKYDEKLAEKQAAVERAQSAYQSALNQGHSPSAKLIAWRDSAAKELADWQAKKFTDKTVLLIDEAGMVGSRHMQRLLQETGKTGAKIVLIGDERQLQAVDAGGAFRALQNRLGYAELNEVRRQRNEADKQAANNLAAGNAVDAISNYAERGLIKIEADADQAKARMVQGWMSDKQTASQKLMMAATRASVRELNDLAREQLTLQHRLVNEHEIATTHGKLAFAECDRILFTRNDTKLGVKNGTLGTVERITLNKAGELTIKVRTDAGQVVEFNPTAEKGYSDINHGYAVTVHKSQGATVDRAYFYAAGAMLDKELGYVAMSRHRDTCEIYCSEHQLENLADRVSAESGIEIQPSENHLDTIKELAGALSRSNAKGTTLDYSEVDELDHEHYEQQHEPIQELLQEDDRRREAAQEQEVVGNKGKDLPPEELKRLELAFEPDSNVETEKD